MVVMVVVVVPPGPVVPPQLGLHHLGAEDLLHLVLRVEVAPFHLQQGAKGGARRRRGAGGLGWNGQFSICDIG